ncbi:ion channel [Allobacillus sp. GCM10007491]|uniref:Two pore domain potassium channel family protein n=1 Tax=Allobacillus saliphilus TaxID=2912308 RepID=A0A941CWI8_9BACI|nr:ion channel [Allobacillus saliphilus]MBR7553955.1 two pore domain potassium channel family protein [Allobacillus saliphilus]
MTTILIVIALLVIVVNLFYFFTNKSYKKSYFHLALFIKLFFVLSIITVAFALLYYAIGLQGTSLMKNSTNEPVETTFWNTLYYSGVTMLSVGYGDYVPVGISRFFSLIQASLGFLLPTAYFLTALGQKESK